MATHTPTGEYWPIGQMVSKSRPNWAHLCHGPRCFTTYETSHTKQSKHILGKISVDNLRTASLQKMFRSTQKCVKKNQVFVPFLTSELWSIVKKTSQENESLNGIKNAFFYIENRSFHNSAIFFYLIFSFKFAISTLSMSQHNLPNIFYEGNHFLARYVFNTGSTHSRLQI